MPFGKGGYSFARRPPSGGLFGSSVGIDMLRMVPKEERRRGWKELARIQRLNAQMARLIEDLLDAPSLDSSQLSLKLSEWVATDLLLQAVEALSATAFASGITFAADATDADGTVRRDAGRVMEILQQHRGKRCEVHIAGRGLHDLWVRRLRARSNSRCGTPDRASRSSNSITSLNDPGRRRRQSKRGVASVSRSRKHLVEAQGGRLWVESSLGAGTIFVFTLRRGRYWPCGHSVGRPCVSFERRSPSMTRAPSA
jgi:light-regulated signal transduction histidine kinase (bacteriophytochrome)